MSSACLLIHMYGKSIWYSPEVEVAASYAVFSLTVDDIRKVRRISDETLVVFVRNSPAMGHRHFESISERRANDRSSRNRVESQVSPKIRRTDENPRDRYSKHPKERRNSSRKCRTCANLHAAWVWTFQALLRRPVACPPSPPRPRPVL